jgi:flagellar FliL protein
MAEEVADAAAKTAKKPGGVMSMLVNGAGIFVLALGAVIVGGAINGKMHPTPDYKLDKDGNFKAVVPSPPPGSRGDGDAKGSVFYAIDPPLVVNFEDGSAVRFLQISMEVMAREQRNIDSVQKNMPLIRNNLLLLMSNREYHSLMSREGKEKLRLEALAEIRAVQKKQGGDDIEDLLFTSFVVQ